jgi:molecular chaperone GrpE
MRYVMSKDDAEKRQEAEAEDKKQKSGAIEKPGEPPALGHGGDEIEYEMVREEEEPPAEKSRHRHPHKSSTEEEKGLRSKLKKRDAEIKALNAEVGELKDKYLRKLAEMENLRKRFDRERADYELYALSDFLRELLTVLDNFERALKNRDQSDGKSFLEGVEMIYRQYSDLLKKKGLRPIEITDKKFDPNTQQAVVTEESETVEEPEVGEELQRGYWLQERLLRPAMVKVLVPKKRETS